MVTDFCDDLNALDAPTSERNFRSDADELDEYLEDEDLDTDAESEDESGSGDDSEEDDETAPQLVKMTDQIRKLHAECLKLGHADPRTTMGYTHVIGDDHRKVAEQLGGFFAQVHLNLPKKGSGSRDDGSQAAV